MTSVVGSKMLTSFPSTWVSPPNTRFRVWRRTCFTRASTVSSSCFIPSKAACFTKDHDDVLFKMLRLGLAPGREPAKSGVWKKPGCSLQDLPPRGRPARPRRLNALDPEPRCSLQEGRRAAADRVGAAADGCGRPHLDGPAGNSSDSRHELHATSAGCRRSLARIPDQSDTSYAGTRYAAWPDTQADYRRLGRDGAWKVGRLAGNTGSSVAGKSLPPRYVWGPTLRRADPSARRRRYRVWCRVPTASSPMGMPHLGKAGKMAGVAATRICEDTRSPNTAYNDATGRKM